MEQTVVIETASSHWKGPERRWQTCISRGSSNITGMGTKLGRPAALSMSEQQCCSVQLPHKLCSTTERSCTFTAPQNLS